MSKNDNGNINNPYMRSDVGGRPVVKGALIQPMANMTVKIRPYIVFLPNGKIVYRNVSTVIDCNNAFGSPPPSTVVTVEGDYRWCTIVLRPNDSGSDASVVLLCNMEAPEGESLVPSRGEHVGFKDSDIILGDVRLYYHQDQTFGGPGITAEDIDLSRSEAANYMDTEMIPVEVYGPPLNQFGNLSDLIKAINDGAMDYRYVVRDGTNYIIFNTIDTSCGSIEIPPGAKTEGAMYLADDGVDKFLAFNFGCAACQTACQSCDAACEPSCDNVTEVTAPYYDKNEGVKKIILTTPPAGFCGSCDIACDAGNDLEPCINCDGSGEQFCDRNCQVGCEVKCDTTDTATDCGDECMTGCEGGCMTVCERYCQVGCEAEYQTPDCSAVCEIAVQSGY